MLKQMLGSIKVRLIVNVSKLGKQKKKDFSIILFEIIK